MRIAGITIPDTKRFPFALTVVYGIGRTRAQEILKTAGVGTDRKAKELTSEEENEIRRLVEGFKIEGELRREISSHIKRLKDIKSYRGTRHARRLPSRGQRTKTNARTLKGVRKTMGSGRRAAEKK